MSDFFTKKSSKNCPPGGVPVFGCEAAPEAMRSAIVVSAKMDGVIVALVHDGFRGMGLSGVSGFLGEGAVLVDVRGMFGGEDAKKQRLYYETL